MRLSVTASIAPSQQLTKCRKMVAYIIIKSDCSAIFEGAMKFTRAIGSLSPQEL